MSDRRTGAKVTKGAKVTTVTTVTITPDCMSSHRPYPVYVYLFAVALYELTDMSQRDAAKITADLFGIESFSASTLCRARKRFSVYADEIFDASEADDNDVSVDINTDDEVVAAVKAAIQDSDEVVATTEAVIQDDAEVIAAAEAAIKDGVAVEADDNDVSVDINADDEVVAAAEAAIQDGAEDQQSKPASYRESNLLKGSSLKDVFSSISWIRTMVECVCDGRQTNRIKKEFADAAGSLARKYYKLYRRLLI